MIDRAEEAIRRGQQAADLLANPLFVEAWEAIEAAIMAQWRDSPVDGAEDREHLFLMLRLLEKLRGVFEQHVANGKIEADNLARLEWARRVNRA